VKFALALLENCSLDLANCLGDDTYSLKTSKVSHFDQLVV
jgi:hypothetical protein